MRLADTAGMTRMRSHLTAQGQSFLRILERPTAPPEARVAAAVSPQAVARRKRPASPRTGLLRLAPRLSVVTGNRREPDWRVIAGGIGAAVADSDVEDAPWSA